MNLTGKRTRQNTEKKKQRYICLFFTECPILQRNLAENFKQFNFVASMTSKNSDF